MPHSVKAMRPTEFRSADRIHGYCTQGLPESKHLSPADDKSSEITVTTWIALLKKSFEERGMDTVMRLYNPLTKKEVYMLDEHSWAGTTKEDALAYVEYLETGMVTKSDGTKVKVNEPCPFDKANLSHSGDFIVNSVKAPLWKVIELECGSNPSGPVALATIINHIQVGTASMVSALTAQLEAMSLKKEPGQDVVNFSTKVTEIARRLDGGLQKVPNLSSLVVSAYLDCDVEQF